MTAKLIYFATRSLDGYVEDAQGKIDFTAPDEASQKFGASESDPPWARDFGSTWRAAEKVIYSKTLKQNHRESITRCIDKALSGDSNVFHQ